MTCTSTASTSTETFAVSVLDVSSLRFRFGPANRSISVLTTTGQHLATVPVSKGTDRSAAAWAVLGQAAQDAQILAPNAQGELVAHSVALYNPFTAHSSWVSPQGDSVTFVGQTTPLPPTGLQLVAVADADGWALRTELGEAWATSRCLTGDDVARALVAYS